MFNQTFDNWDILVSDDGSTDNTIQLIEEKFKSNSKNRLRFRKNMVRGYGENFLRSLKDSGNYDYFSFCDQDDIWLPEKLEKAINAIKLTERTTQKTDWPVFYSSRTIIVDKNLNHINLSASKNKFQNFSNSLVENSGGGNTVVINRALKELICKIPNSRKIISHDWIFYQICTFVDGEVIFDNEPKILYRQHKENLLGWKGSIGGKFSRLMLVFNNYFSKVNECNIKILEDLEAFGTTENLQTLLKFKNIRVNQGLLGLRMFLFSGIKRHSSTETLVVGLLILSNRF